MYSETADDLEFDVDCDIGDEADDHFFYLKAASKGPDALKMYLEGLPRHAKEKTRTARNTLTCKNQVQSFTFRTEAG